MMGDHDCKKADPCPKCEYEPFYAELDNFGGECPSCGYRPLGAWE